MKKIFLLSFLAGIIFSCGKDNTDSGTISEESASLLVTTVNISSDGTLFSDEIFNREYSFIIRFAEFLDRNYTITESISGESGFYYRVDNNGILNFSLIDDKEFTLTDNPAYLRVGINELQETDNKSIGFKVTITVADDAGRVLGIAVRNYNEALVEWGQGEYPEANVFYIPLENVTTNSYHIRYDIEAIPRFHYRPEVEFKLNVRNISSSEVQDFAIYNISLNNYGTDGNSDTGNLVGSFEESLLPGEIFQTQVKSIYNVYTYDINILTLYYNFEYTNWSSTKISLYGNNEYIGETTTAATASFNLSGHPVYDKYTFTVDIELN
ncbi:MAG: hypothetical protein LIO79_02440 [Rikenellaceae bacterium]|nr:hypothetical protein [Rikenellaceae bacterium]